MKPILFNTKMVNAILDGRKTVTRRVVPERLLDKYYEYDEWCDAVMPQDIPCTRDYERKFFQDKAPYQIGDVLWVRETWQKVFDPEWELENKPIREFIKNFDEIQKTLTWNQGHDGEAFYVYKASDIQYANDVMLNWHPSIHMPKEAARIFLKVTDVRVERLQEITEEQAIKEGCYHGPLFEGGKEDEITAKSQFISLWESTIKKQDLDTYGWDANPWAWVIEFERISKGRMRSE